MLTGEFAGEWGCPILGPALGGFLTPAEGEQARLHIAGVCSIFLRSPDRTWSGNHQACHTAISSRGIISPTIRSRPKSPPSPDLVCARPDGSDETADKSLEALQQKSTVARRHTMSVSRACTVIATEHGSSHS